MVDIHSVTVEIRHGKKEERKKQIRQNIMSISATQGGHNNVSFNAIRPGSVFKPKPKPHFLGETEPKPKARF